jgi:isopenicillin N synthase-like dioxygenase
MGELTNIEWCDHTFTRGSAAPRKDGQARCGEHTDWGTITLLFQGGQGGPEVRRRWLTASC